MYYYVEWVLRFIKYDFEFEWLSDGNLDGSELWFVVRSDCIEWFFWIGFWF